MTYQQINTVRELLAELNISICQQRDFISTGKSEGKRHNDDRKTEFRAKKRSSEKPMSSQLIAVQNHRKSTESRGQFSNSGDLDLNKAPFPKGAYQRLLEEMERAILDTHHELRDFRQMDPIKSEQEVVEFGREDIVLKTDKKLKSMVLEHIEQFSPFLIYDLGLNDFALEIGMSRSELSNVINREFSLNFNSFINGYRIEHFKNLIKTGELAHYSIEGLMKQSGFRPKSTFYKAFKKREGILPKEYALISNEY